MDVETRVRSSRMLHRRESRARLLWFGGGLLIAAVTILAVLQYKLLNELRGASLGARALAADVVADEIVAELSSYLGRNADASLDLTRSQLEDPVASVAHLMEKDFLGAREFFVAQPDDSGMIVVRFLDRKQRLLVERPQAEAMRAIEFAMHPWSTPERRRTLRRPTRTARSERPAIFRGSSIDLDVLPADRLNRVVLHPVGVLDEFAGATGFLIDERYVTETLLPRIIERVLERKGQSALRVSVVQMGSGRLVYGQMPSPGAGPIVRSSLGFGLGDFIVEIHERADSAAVLASRSFALNVGLLLFVALSAIAGALLTIRAARKQMQLAAMKSDFVSNVTHELRTPLTSIRLFGRLLRTGAGNSPESIAYGGHIEAESERLTHMVERVLDASRLEERKLTRETPVDLVAVIHSALREHDAVCRERGFEIHCQLPPPPVMVDGDQAALTSAVSNLIENAIRYSGNSRQIAIELREDTSYYEVVVRDHGIGIAAADHDRIFERFYRVDDPLVRSVRGTGLGLSIVRSIVQAHRGRVSVASRRREGSTFVIRLPNMRESE